jgi:hypothetical protein
MRRHTAPLATSALVFMYASAPLALGGLRREDPGWPAC